MVLKVKGLRDTLRRRLADLNRLSSGGKGRRAPGDLLVPAPKVQQNFWCLDQLAPNQGIVNVSRAWRIEGSFDPERCHQALVAQTRKHDCLRCDFRQHEGLLQIRVAEHKAADFAQQDLRAPLEDDTPMWLVDALLQAESQRSFAAGSDPLLRLRAYQIADQAWVLHLVYHHAIMDGWSLGQFCQELGQVYDEPSPQPDTGLAVRPDHDFGDYARDLPTPLQTAGGEHPEPVPELDLPFDFAPPKLPSYRGNSTPIQIDAQTWSKIETLAAELHVSPISVLLAAYRLALFEISGQRDFCIGNTAMTRDAPGLQQMLGAFVQTLPIRAPLLPGVGFGDLCQTEQAALARALEQANASQSQASATTQA